MSSLKDKYGDWALVVGAALGLGKSFCNTLAKQGFNLIMIDNQEKPLMELSTKLSSTFNIETLEIHIDLFNPDSAFLIVNKIKNLNCRLLIYNAAFSRIKKLTDHSTEELNQFLNINLGSQLKLVHLFSKAMIDKKQNGGILLLSSLAGLMGMQLIAPYAATKAFTWNLAEALHHELKPYDIDVTACIAGATATEAYLNTNPKYGFLKPQVQQPDVVADTAIKMIGKKGLYISGFSNRVNYFILTRLLPRKWASRIANNTMRKMYPDV